MIAAQKNAETCERITVALTAEAAAALTALCGRRRTKTGAVNRALEVCAYLEEQAAGGAALLIRQPDGTTELVRFL
jgi:hypothetical protein